MTLLSPLFDGITLDTRYSDLTKEIQEKIDPESMIGLFDFPKVPYDYLVLYASYGPIGFVSKDYGYSFYLRHPVEAHEFIFEMKRESLMPGLFPFASISRTATLYYGDVEGSIGVYAAKDATSWLEITEYVAPSLSDIIYNGIGYHR